MVKKNSVLGLILLLAITSAVLFLLVDKFKSSSKQINIKEENIISSPSQRDDFITYQLSKYPKFQAENPEESIKRVFPLIKRVNGRQETIWVVEILKEMKGIRHYLLTPDFEKELVNSMSCVSSEASPSPSIELEKVQMAKYDYIVLSGTKNSCYGGAESGFVSIYDTNTGNKIKFQGNFDFLGSIWKGVSPTENALGKLRGIYGSKNPQIMVEYGGGLSYEAMVVAFFDLKTGKLNKLVEME